MQDVILVQNVAQVLQIKLDIHDNGNIAGITIATGNTTGDYLWNCNLVMVRWTD